MSEPKWTPGPWTAEERGYGAGSVFLVTAKTNTGAATTLARLNSQAFRPDRNANVALIAAAPDLYEALYRMTVDAKLTGVDKQAGWDAWVAMADAALAKARGEGRHA